MPHSKKRRALFFCDMVLYLMQNGTILGKKQFIYMAMISKEFCCKVAAAMIDSAEHIDRVPDIHTIFPCLEQEKIVCRLEQTPVKHDIKFLPG